MPLDRAQLRQGQIGESEIGKWVIGRGSCVLPVYEIELDHGKGPRFWTPKGTLVAPDMFVMPAMIWIEAKHKSVFTWYRKKERWVTGIDLHHYRDYQQVQKTSGRRVWLLFLHRESTPHFRDLDAGCPEQCPVGLFGAALDVLTKNESHQHENWGPHGMVYWAVPPLKLISTLEDMQLSSPGGNLTGPGP